MVVKTIEKGTVDYIVPVLKEVLKSNEAVWEIKTADMGNKGGIYTKEVEMLKNHFLFYGQERDDEYVMTILNTYYAECIKVKYGTKGENQRRIYEWLKNGKHEVAWVDWKSGGYREPKYCKQALRHIGAPIQLSSRGQVLFVRKLEDAENYQLELEDDATSTTLTKTEYNTCLELIQAMSDTISMIMRQNNAKFESLTRRVDAQETILRKVGDILKED